MNVGDTVWFREDVVDETGVVVEPTNDELLDAFNYEYPIGPDHGDVMVEWSYGRYWETVDNLEKVNG